MRGEDERLSPSHDEESEAACFPVEFTHQYLVVLGGRVRGLEGVLIGCISGCIRGCVDRVY